MHAMFAGTCREIVILSRGSLHSKLFLPIFCTCWTPCRPDPGTPSYSAVKQMCESLRAHGQSGLREQFLHVDPVTFADTIFCEYNLPTDSMQGIKISCLNSGLSLKFRGLSLKLSKLASICCNTSTT